MLNSMIALHYGNRSKLCINSYYVPQHLWGVGHIDFCADSVGIMASVSM